MVIMIIDNDTSIIHYVFNFLLENTDDNIIMYLLFYLKIMISDKRKYLISLYMNSLNLLHKIYIFFFSLIVYN